RPTTRTVGTAPWPGWSRTMTGGCNCGRAHRKRPGRTPGSVARPVRSGSIARSRAARPRPFQWKRSERRLKAYPNKGSDPLNLGGQTPFWDRRLSDWGNRARPGRRRGLLWARTVVMTRSTETPRLPRISVVTPSFNQAPFLEECLRSVLDQGYDNLEY